MCNMVMPKGSRAVPRPIPEKGTGWKIFRSDSLMRPAMVTDVDCYICGSDGWVDWLPNLSSRPGNGFAFFLTKKEAERALDAIKRRYNWIDRESERLCLKKIEYSKGLVSRQERNFITGKRFTIALCKSWRLANEEK